MNSQRFHNFCMLSSENGSSNESTTKNNTNINDASTEMNGTIIASDNCKMALSVILIIG